MSIRGIAVLGYGEGNKEDEIATAFFKRFAMTLLLEIATFALLARNDITTFDGIGTNKTTLPPLPR